MNQWSSEIERHSPVCKVLKYEGMAVEKNKTIDFSSFDIILTTYEVLRNEIHYAKELRTLRHPKKYIPKRTPLVEHFWWRVCLDEAQMIESPTAHAAQMALKLQTKYRWCVTGTPISKSLDDLYGLLLFLRLEPFTSKSFWLKAISGPFMKNRLDPIKGLLKHHMWRNSKDIVASELELPEQKQGIFFQAVIVVNQC
jgi:E3 ubiquitin-protein ligase SHPRH